MEGTSGDIRDKKHHKNPIKNHKATVRDGVV